MMKLGALSVPGTLIAAPPVTPAGKWPRSATALEVGWVRSSLQVRNAWWCLVLCAASRPLLPRWTEAAGSCSMLVCAAETVPRGWHRADRAVRESVSPPAMAVRREVSRERCVSSEGPPRRGSAPILSIARVWRTAVRQSRVGGHVSETTPGTDTSAENGSMVAHGRSRGQPKTAREEGRCALLCLGASTFIRCTGEAYTRRQPLRFHRRHTSSPPWGDCPPGPCPPRPPPLLPQAWCVRALPVGICRAPESRCWCVRVAFS